jgi:hypothetical protein
MSHLSKFCGEKAHSRQQINDAPFERGISNGKAACGKVSRVHRVVLGESRANRTLPRRWPFGRVTGVADHSGSVASWLESGAGASYGIMRANCPDLPGQLQSAGGLPPETHGNPWPEAQR